MHAKAYESIELFAGTAWYTRAMKATGHPSASLDILLKDEFPSDAAGGSGMDMTSTAGFACLVDLCWQAF